MTDSLFRKPTVVIAALIMGGCMNANTRPVAGEDTLAEASVCQETLIITSKSPDKEGAHFYKGHKFELIGPLKPNGDYLLWILPGRPETAKPDIYVAENQDAWQLGDKSVNFKIDIVPVKDLSKNSQHLNYELHGYKMVLTYHESDGCPEYAGFDGQNHKNGKIAPDHPGHAGASRL